MDESACEYLTPSLQLQLYQELIILQSLRYLTAILLGDLTDTDVFRPGRDSVLGMREKSVCNLIHQLKDERLEHQKFVGALHGDSFIVQLLIESC